MLRTVTSQLLYPLIQGCETRDPKLSKVHCRIVKLLCISFSYLNFIHYYLFFQICLGAIQRFITHNILDEKGARYVTDVMWLLMENNIEEVKVLQTSALLLTTNNLVCGESLSKVLLFLMLNFHQCQIPITYVYYS